MAITALAHSADSTAGSTLLARIAEWRVDAAIDRDVWRKWGTPFVDTIAPFQACDLTSRSRMRGQRRPHAPGVVAAAADVHGEEDLTPAAYIADRDTNADSPIASPALLPASSAADSQ